MTANARFLGGVAEVGRLGLVLEKDGVPLLFDYGIAPHDPPEFPLPSPPVEAAFLSHAHLDHSGMLPQFVGAHRAPVVATAPSAAMCDLLVADSLKIAKQEGYRLPFGPQEAALLRETYDFVDYGDTRSFGDVEVEAVPAGHIPGSCMFEVRGSTTTLFTGDLQLVDSHLVTAAKPRRCDNLILEATYAGREHAPRAEVERRFVETIQDVREAGGIAVVPAFAVGRMQEVLLALHGHGFEVYLDGMGKHVTRIMLDSPEFLRDAKRLQRAFREANVVQTPHARKAALAQADVILTTSGMLEGGPVLYYVEKLRGDARNAILLTGYQVPGTGGRHLLDHGTLPIRGVNVPVSMKIDRFDFSGHAGHKELVSFIRACDPQNVVLFHSDDREPLAKELGEEYRFFLPQTGDVVELA